MVTFAASGYNLRTNVRRVIVSRNVASETLSHGNSFAYSVVTDRI